MSYTYDTLKTALADLLVYRETDTDFTDILPSAIDYAEQRLYREMNLLATVVRDTSSATAANARTFNLPTASGRFVVVDAINIFTPTGTTDERHPVLPVSLNYADTAWPSASAASASDYPVCFAMITDQTLSWGPTPGNIFTVEVVGHIRPAALSEANQTTFLTLYLPDLFFAAMMVFMTGFQRDFGAQADDPRQAVSWETQYKALFESANGEEVRRKFAGPGWSSKEPQPLAVQPR